MDEPLGQIIKTAIKEEGWSFASIAKKMGISRQALTKIDLRKKFDLEFLEDLKEATGLDYTSHYYATKKKRRVDVKEERQNLHDPDEKRVEISLTIKLSAASEDINSMGQLLVALRAEAKKHGFNCE